VLSLDELYVCMAPLTRHWPEPTPEQWSDYHALLRHLDGDVLMAACLKVMATHVYPTFPKPALLLEAAASITKTVERSGVEAWGDVLRAVRLYGHRNPPGPENHWDFRDARVRRIVDSLGWKEICMTNEDDVMALRAHFIKSYEQVRDREDEQARELPAVANVRQQIAAQREMQRVTAQLTAGKGHSQ
jgi:hypothetical protein